MTSAQDEIAREIAESNEQTRRQWRVSGDTWNMGGRQDRHDAIVAQLQLCGSIVGDLSRALGFNPDEVRLLAATSSDLVWFHLLDGREWVRLSRMFANGRAEATEGERTPPISTDDKGRPGLPGVAPAIDDEVREFYDAMDGVLGCPDSPAKEKGERKSPDCTDARSPVDRMEVAGRIEEGAKQGAARREKTVKRYLGDGVFAEYDGHRLNLTAKFGGADGLVFHTIHLAPDVMDEMVRFNRNLASEVGGLICSVCNSLAKTRWGYLAGDLSPCCGKGRLKKAEDAEDADGRQAGTLPLSSLSESDYLFMAGAVGLSLRQHTQATLSDLATVAVVTEGQIRAYVGEVDHLSFGPCGHCVRRRPE